MPNWCENKLVITFNSTEAAQDFEHALSASEGLLEFLKPMPDHIHKGPIGHKDGKKQYLSEYDVDTNENRLIKEVDEDDKDNWYDWSTANWGTKWSESELETTINGTQVELTFETAWSPPIEGLDGTVQALPGFSSATLLYVESGCDFVGYTNFYKGNNPEDNWMSDNCEELSAILAEYGAVEWSDEEDNYSEYYESSLTARNDFFFDNTGHSMDSMGLGG